ncbi:hypothetical protein LAU_0033 [Lausannevirus]|uniref:Uncharacterized protein n=1 Tax=Lausannevirus TaxID=999883 RepID=F2WKW6_9VIRU|nr:hypothetical protein LAU_0033 [Lausannevirus]AEA06889.1 hypothetical protein LAU_0033 [Lausannevirus]
MEQVLKFAIQDFRMLPLSEERDYPHYSRLISALEYALSLSCGEENKRLRERFERTHDIFQEKPEVPEKELLEWVSHPKNLSVWYKGKSVPEQAPKELLLLFQELEKISGGEPVFWKRKKDVYFVSFSEDADGQEIPFERYRSRKEHSFIRCEKGKFSVWDAKYRETVNCYGLAVNASQILWRLMREL